VKSTPLLGEPFGGCAGLVEVGIERESFGEAVPPGPDHRVAERNHPAAASGSRSLEENGEGHAAEVAELLDHLVKVLVRGEPILKEAAYRFAALKDTHTARRHIPDRIRPVHRDHAIEVAAIVSLDGLSQRFLQVGRRALLWHRLRPW